MTTRVPDRDAVRRLLSDIETGPPPTDQAFTEIIREPSLTTGLDHWHLWTLICLCRHLPRQEWVGHIVKTRLNGDLASIGSRSYMGHPEGVPGGGAVPGAPDWLYDLHGYGCFLMHAEQGIWLDVDFTREGTCERIDAFFYSSYLEHVKQPEFPERVLQRRRPREDAWRCNISNLADEGCIDTHDKLRVTSLGKAVVDALEPIVEKCSELSSTRTEPAQRQLLRIALELGDWPLSADLAMSMSLDPVIHRQIVDAAEETKAKRGDRLRERLEGPAIDGDGYRLAAFADLGIARTKTFMEGRALRSPVDGLACLALEILADWDQPDLTEFLLHLVAARQLEAVARQMTTQGDSLWDQWWWDYHVVCGVTNLLRRVGPHALHASLQPKLVTLLDSANGKNCCDAPLLTYALDRPRGLARFRTALSSEVPVVREAACAACVFVGTHETEQILTESLEGPNLEVQHLAMCALASLPSSSARQRAADWLARHAGINSPAEGHDAIVDGRSVRLYSLKEVSRAQTDESLTLAIERLRRKFQSIILS